MLQFVNKLAEFGIKLAEYQAAFNKPTEKRVCQAIKKGAQQPPAVTLVQSQMQLLEKEATTLSAHLREGCCRWWRCTPAPTRRRGSRTGSRDTRVDVTYVDVTEVDVTRVPPRRMLPLVAMYTSTDAAKGLTHGLERHKG